jgi:hypothetical protein
MDKTFYFDQLYPFQDAVLGLINGAGTGFYLTGGTALSRAYLRHRFSDDLDLFVNDEDRFGIWASKVIQAVRASTPYDVKVLQQEERFVRLMLVDRDVSLRIEMVNDVPAHIGDTVSHAVLGQLDSAENILANKVRAAIDRDEPKDLADIWGLCCKMSLPLKAAICRQQSSRYFPCRPGPGIVFGRKRTLAACAMDRSAASRPVSRRTPSSGRKFNPVRVTFAPQPRNLRQK